MINYKIRGSDWLMFPLVIVNFNHFFIQPTLGRSNTDANVLSRTPVDFQTCMRVWKMSSLKYKSKYSYNQRHCLGFRTIFWRWTENSLPRTNLPFLSIQFHRPKTTRHYWPSTILLTRKTTPISSEQEARTTWYEIIVATVTQTQKRFVTT